MAGKQSSDSFANLAIVTVTESAANTLTFKKLETGISLNEKVAWIISRVEYFCDSLTPAQMQQDQDSVQWGISVSNAFATASISEVTVLDYNWVQREVFGAGVSVELLHQPYIKDFSSLPGGGIIVPPAPIYLFAKGNGLAAVSTIYARIHYTLLQLAVEDYWQLVEARRVLSS